MTASTIDCDEAVRLLAAYLDRELDSGDEALVSLHLESCRTCCSRAEFEQRLRLHLSQLRRAPVEPELELRVKRVLGGFGPTQSGAPQT